MRICLITYEYPPDTAIGGIGTYMYQLSTSFAKKGIETEVICASPDQEGVFSESPYLSITKIRCNSTEEFRELAPATAKKLHDVKKIDIIECPEFGAPSLHLKNVLPEVPVIIKLHTPRFLIKELNDHYYNKVWWRRLKRRMGFTYHYKKDNEYLATLQADHILSPSVSLKEIIQERWKIEPEKISLVPNPYFPSKELLTISPGSDTKSILYIGRLETRKGVYNLARAIPLVVKKIPDARFVFLGRDSIGPCREQSMKKLIINEAGNAVTNISFVDHVPLTSVPGFLAQAHCCVFPSTWENFPGVCLEAMAAARNIIASKNGGMADMLQSTGNHQLIDPFDVSSIAEKLINTLEQPQDLTTVLKNRKKILNEYGDKIIESTLDVYKSFIKK